MSSIDFNNFTHPINPINSGHICHIDTFVATLCMPLALFIYEWNYFESASVNSCQNRVLVTMRVGDAWPYVYVPAHQPSGTNSHRLELRTRPCYCWCITSIKRQFQVHDGFSVPTLIRNTLLCTGLRLYKELEWKKDSVCDWTY